MLNNLRSLRKATNLKVADLSELSGVSVTHIWKLEQQTASSPTVRIAYLIANALNLHIRDIWPDPEELK